MKKNMLLLVVLPLICMNVALFGAEEPSMDNECTQELSDCLDNEYAQEFSTGLAAGAVAGLSVEFLRNHVLPDMTSWNLYGNYGICRDQLAGEAKVATALLVGAAYAKSLSGADIKKLSARLLGVITGACAFSFAAKVFLTT